MARVSDRWVSIALSVLLHAALLAALVYGWLLFRQPPRPAPTLAIEARIVDARAARGAPTPQPAPPPVAPPQSEPPQDLGPPQPTPEELAQREQQRRQAEEAAAEQRRAAQQKAAAEQAAKQAAEEQAAKRAAEEQAAKRVAEQRAAEARAAAERKAQEHQRLAEAQEKSERETELRRSLAAEEQAKAARSGPALASWQSMIAAKITRAWLRPPTARPGIECMLYVTQVPGGEVTQVRIGECNGDQAVRQSIEAAVYRASPLPPPPDPALFDRNLKINFKPD
jgi:colicin import membrane protein